MLPNRNLAAFPHPIIHVVVMHTNAMALPTTCQRPQMDETILPSGCVACNDLVIGAANKKLSRLGLCPKRPWKAQGTPSLEENKKRLWQNWMTREALKCAPHGLLGYGEDVSVF